MVFAITEKGLEPKASGLLHSTDRRQTDSKAEGDQKVRTLTSQTRKGRCAHKDKNSVLPLVKLKLQASTDSNVAYP